MAHATAKLTSFGRRLLIERVTHLAWSVATAAAALGVSRATAYHWLRRYREERPAGLAERPSRPHRSSHALDALTARRIPARRSGQALRARSRLRYGPSFPDGKDGGAPADRPAAGAGARGPRVPGR